MRQFNTYSLFPHANSGTDCLLPRLRTVGASA
uniref:Uncharacterized protein n=1 Tax=Arundo donax TaxID=35708 RepID=A0A0A8XZQ9_ARUDO